ncbi:AaceriAGL326Wp [[Ashbya] aceris (nom. inval.)]|nr:AaceriAGL326Wp [[Ashbya] aceris (nom. inval.)]
MDVLMGDPKDLGSSNQFGGNIDYNYAEKQTFVHGRGVFDKSHLIGLLEAFEYTLEVEPSDWIPPVDIVIALGFDEQLGGKLGGAELSKVLQSKFGTDGFEYILSKDLAGVQEYSGAYIAPIGITTKQEVHYTLQFTLTGYLVTPLKSHNMFQIFNKLTEKLQQFPEQYYFTHENPHAKLYQCAAPDLTFLSPDELKDLLAAFDDEEANKRVLKLMSMDFYTGNVFGTKQQYTHIAGGSEFAVRPEFLQVEIKEWLPVESSVELRLESLKKALKDIIGDLGLVVNGEIIKPEGLYGKCEVTVEATPKDEYSPVGRSWEGIAGIVKGLYEDTIFPTLPNSPSRLHIGPGISVVRTDASRYKYLSKNIYYFRPGLYDYFGTTVWNTRYERVSVQNLMHTVAFFHQLIHAP